MNNVIVLKMKTPRPEIRTGSFFVNRAVIIADYFTRLILRTWLKLPAVIR
mgnify:CR=1 FL=1